MIDSARFFILLVVLLVAFASGMAILARVQSSSVRGIGFVVLALTWLALSLALMRIVHAHMVEVAAAWLVAVLLWGVLRLLLIVVRPNKRHPHDGTATS